MAKVTYEELIAGGYTPKDADEIICIYLQYNDERFEIEAELESEGKPGNGSDYELRCEQAWEFYQEQLDLIDAKYKEVL